MGVTLSGSDVSTWANMGYKGSAQNLTQAISARRPSYTSSDANFAGNAALIFDASNSESLSGTGYTLAQPVELWFIARMDLDPPTLAGRTGSMLFGGPSSVTNYPWTDSVIYEGNLRTAFTTTVNPATSLTTTHCYTVLSDSTNWQSYLNGSLLSTKAVSFAFPTSSQSFFVGQSNPSYHANGRFAEILLFSATLTAPQRTNLKSYLSNRYGITIA